MSSVAITTPGDREVMVTRVFDATRDLVFDALTKPELIRRWYGPVGSAMEVCEVDLRPGGKWRFVSRKPNGKVIGQHGVYREIAAPSRIVNTEAWEDWDAGETLVTTMLVEKGGKTTLTSRMLFPSREVRDTILKSGLEGSVGPVYDKLAEVLATL
jgi:uncharacterized protein YndB with AHSA1/START domain